MNPIGRLDDKVFFRSVSVVLPTRGIGRAIIGISVCAATSRIEPAVIARRCRVELSDHAILASLEVERAEVTTGVLGDPMDAV